MRLSLLPLCLLAAPAFAETDVRQLLIDHAKANGCALTEDYAEATFPKLGLTQDDVTGVVGDMIAAGEATADGGTFRLSAELCTGEAAPKVMPTVSPLMGRVIEVFRAHGCAMTEDEGVPALLAAGITEAELDTLVDESDALAKAGWMIRDMETMTIRFEEQICQGAVVAADPAETLIRMLREHGCGLTQDEAAGLVGDYGTTMEAADAMADSLMERGLARQEGDRLVLEACGD